MLKTIKYLSEVVLTLIICTCNRPSHWWTKEDFAAAQMENQKLLRLIKDGFTFENIRNIIFLAACVILIILNLRGVSVYARYENYQAQRQVVTTLAGHDVREAVRRVTVETDDPNIRNLFRKVDFRGTTHTFTFTFAPDSINGRQHFADQAHAVIQALRAEGFSPETINFWYFGHGFTYRMHLEGERINLSATELEGRIHEMGYYPKLIPDSLTGVATII